MPASPLLVGMSAVVVVVTVAVAVAVAGPVSEAEEAAESGPLQEPEPELGLEPHRRVFAAEL